MICARFFARVPVKKDIRYRIITYFATVTHSSVGHRVDDTPMPQGDVALPSRFVNSVKLLRFVTTRCLISTRSTRLIPILPCIHVSILFSSIFPTATKTHLARFNSQSQAAVLCMERKLDVAVSLLAMSRSDLLSSQLGHDMFTIS